MSIYLKYGSLKGDVTTAGFRGWIEVEGFSWGNSRKIETAARGAATREMSEPTISNLSVTKRWDGSSPDLMLESLSGRHEAEVMLKLTRTQADGVGTFLTLKFTDCALAGYQVAAHEGSSSMPSENLSINFTKIYCSYNPQDAQGRPAGNYRMGYDLLAMHKL